MKILNSKTMKENFNHSGMIKKVDVKLISYNEVEALYEIVFYFNPIEYIIIDVELDDA